MSFWDSSAVVPLLLRQPATHRVQEILRARGVPVVWWGALIECHSVVERLRRDAELSLEHRQQALAVLAELAASWQEVQPTPAVRAVRLLSVHPLRAADAVQLAAALVWAGEKPAGCILVCLDSRLRECAQREGFTVLPRRSLGN